VPMKRRMAKPLSRLLIHAPPGSPTPATSAYPTTNALLFAVFAVKILDVIV
jgi:hypothetical protein